MSDKDTNLMQGMSGSDRLHGIDPAVLQQFMQLMMERKGSSGDEPSMTFSAAQNTQEIAGRNQDINLLMQLLEQRLAPEEKRKWDMLRVMASLLGVR